MTQLQKLLILICVTLVSGCASIKGSDEDSDDPMVQAAAEARRMQSNPRTKLDLGEGRELQIQRALRLGEVTLGMTTEDVLHVWGQPRWVESAGMSENHDQRWVYVNGLSERRNVTPWKTVYFEGGRVAGWETQPASQ